MVSLWCFLCVLFLSLGSTSVSASCDDYAKKRYDECMEIAKEAKEGEDGVTTSKHSKEEAAALENGGCKKMLDKDIENCKKKT